MGTLYFNLENRVNLHGGNGATSGTIPRQERALAEMIVSNLHFVAYLSYNVQLVTKEREHGRQCICESED